jgi:hypothetical protein
VEEERLRDNCEVEASMTFEDYRGIPAGPAGAVPAAGGSANTTSMPFKVTIVDRVASGSVVLTFHEIVLNPTLKPEDLGLVARLEHAPHENSGG